MTARKRRDQSKQTAIVVLEGIKVSTENTGLAPLSRAVHDVVNPDDEILVLTLLHVKIKTASGREVGRHCNQSCEYMRFLQEEISRKKEVYLRIFRPFYNSCKSNRVKFQVKIAAGFRPKDIIIEEANNVRATWIVVDSLSLASDDEEHVNFLHYEPPESTSARDTASNPKSPKLRKGSITEEVSHVSDSLSPTIDQESGDQAIYQPRTDSEPTTEAIQVEQKKQDNISTKVEIIIGQPMQLTWELIEEITEGFKSRICGSQNRNFTSYYGFVKEHQSFVWVKRYPGDSSSILEAEKKAALSLHHKNILPLIGYHRSEHGIILIFPLGRGGTLDKYIWEQGELTFQDKLKIATGIANAIRYMHEECAVGPVAHGRLQPSNIFLSSDLQPMISGFEHATWLQFRHDIPAFCKRYQLQLEDSLDHESMVLIKSDIFSFGVLLLRLFCRKSVPQDDQSLIEWARPLLLDRAFHMLLDDENSDDLDVHEMFRVMAAARMCTMSKPISRSSISEVISILKGENFCTIQSSP